jgi:hypothetical protein
VAAVTALGGTFGTTGHTEWVDGKIFETGFTATFAPNTNVQYSNGSTPYDVDFISKTESATGAVPTYAAITSRSYHAGVVNSAMMDASVRTVANNIDSAIWRAASTRNGGETTDRHSLGCLFRPSLTARDYPPGKRDDRDANDADDHEFEVLFDGRHISECVACAHADADPQYGGGDVENREVPISHGPAPSHEGHKCADDRQELSQHDGFAAMPFVKGMSFIQVIAVEQAVPKTLAVVGYEYTRADVVAN